MASLTVKQWNTWPPINVVLSDINGYINLTTASQVKLIMKGTTGPSPALVTGVMTVASAGGGNVTYQFGPNDLSVADTYNVEFAVFWVSGGLETVPSNGYDQIVVAADLDGQTG